MKKGTFRIMILIDGRSSHVGNCSKLRDMKRPSPVPVLDFMAVACALDKRLRCDLAVVNSCIYNGYADR
jgi:hypothetical protein